MSDGKNGFSNFAEFDFKPIGKAIRVDISDNESIFLISL